MKMFKFCFDKCLIRISQLLLSMMGSDQEVSLTWLDFQTLRTGMPAMMELGSSSAAELTVSLAPMTKT